MATTNSYTIHQFWCSGFFFFDSCWYDSCHNTIEQNCFEWSKRQLSATRSILWKKNRRTFWPIHMPRTQKKKTVFEPTEIQTITLYLTVSSFTTVSNRTWVVNTCLINLYSLCFVINACELHLNFCLLAVLFTSNVF